MKGGTDSEHGICRRLKKVEERRRHRSHIYESKQERVEKF